MKDSFVSHRELSDFGLWDKTSNRRIPFSFDIEITARCNNNCRHCYINLPENDVEARNNELTLDEISELAQEAVSLGSLWCLISGGEPLLREDFEEIYIALKKAGLLVSVFTNATLISDNHIKLFKKYPPRDIEVTVYGVTEKTYGRVTRRPSLFHSFQNGLGKLLQSDIKVRLKAMALRSNLAELKEIDIFCRKLTKDFYRFDPFLHFRYDRDSVKNKQIESERLTADEIIALEQTDPQRWASLRKKCDTAKMRKGVKDCGNLLFQCNAGDKNFSVGSDGSFRICSSFHNQLSTYLILDAGASQEAWNHFIPKIRKLRAKRNDYIDNCGNCELIDLCYWCPAHAFLETGEPDAPVEYFCQIAKARKATLDSKK